MNHHTDPTNEKAPGVSDDCKGLTTDTNGVDFRTDGPIQQAPAPDGNAIATQIARLALAGHVVHKGQSGDYLVSKFGLTRYCANFTELAAFAKKVGAA